MQAIQLLLVAPSLALLGCGIAAAHNPVFSPGPHVLYKEGVEIHVGAHGETAEQDKTRELDLELTYGLTGDWAAGVELPYLAVEDNTNDVRGIGDMRWFTKYRFWRKESLGVQESVAVFLNVMQGNGDAKTNPSLGSGTTDSLLGFTYGYESLTWYRWTSIRYRRNGENSVGLRRGDKWLLDFALGYRPSMPVYRKPDTVWILELNIERGQRAVLNGLSQAASGGVEWFVSPGIFWTLRNFAIKSGVQFPIASQLNGQQAASDYRVKMEFEWHL